MTTINLEQARRLVHEEINKPNLNWIGKPEMVVLDEHTIEKDYGWVFFWTSRLWLETGDLENAIAGNEPILVSRYDGSIYQCGSAAPLEKEIRKQELRLQKEISDSSKR